MYSTGKFAILYTGASLGLELTTYETCAPCNTCKVFIKGFKQIPTKINTGLFLRHLDFSCLSLTCMSFVFGKKFGTD